MWATRASTSSACRLIWICPEFASIDGADGLDVVSAGAERGGAFYLDTPEARAVVENEVVALAVGPGFSDAESQAGGFEEEGGFGKVSGLGGVAVCGFGNGFGQ